MTTRTPLDARAFAVAAPSPADEAVIRATAFGDNKGGIFDFSMKLVLKTIIKQDTRAREVLQFKSEVATKRPEVEITRKWGGSRAAAFRNYTTVRHLVSRNTGA